MRSKVQELLQNKLYKNSRNFISYYEGNERKIKYYRDLVSDIDILLEHLNYLRLENGVETIAILGHVSYDWMLADLACIKGGFKSVAIPEVFSFEQVRAVLKETGCDILLLDYRLVNVFSKLDTDLAVYTIAAPEVLENSIFKTNRLKLQRNEEIRETYGICFSSGTSEKLKVINLNFLDIPVKKGVNSKIRKKILQYFLYKTSIWSRRDNKVIIFMPFSHFQQRATVLKALLMGVNIVLSDFNNCLKHIITEKPNVMVSVPSIYEIMAQRIRVKLGRLSKPKMQLFQWFNYLRINALPNHNILKRLLSQILFKDIAKIYGGRADYFVTGSAAINPDVLKLFFSIGVRIYEAYGQTETDVISMNSLKCFKIGSVGKPFLKVKIADDSEILIKYEDEKYDHNKSLLNISEDGYIHTGDLGYLDKDGYLFLKGRKDDVIVFSNGKKIYPTEVEGPIMKSDLIGYALVFLNGNETLSLIISPINGRIMEKEIIKTVIELNAQVPYYCKIAKLMIAPVPFSSEDGLLTSTFKMKRKTIIEKYSKEKFTPILESNGY